MLFTLGIVMSACTPDDGGSLSTNINGTTITLRSSSSGIHSFMIYSSGDWSIASDSGWLTFAPSSGSGDAVVVMSYAANTESRLRTGDFTITGAKSLTYSVTQPAGSDNSGSGTDYSWLELPEVEASPDEMFVTHYATINGKTVRNYSMLYSSENFAATWVAYPLHISHLSGVQRTNDWGWDTAVPRSWQANLFSSYGTGDSRGHQIPSADRLTTTELNSQTFFFTNMTPQDYDFNGGEWAVLEAWMRTNTKTLSDTLYVVTGAVFRTVGGNETVKHITNKNDGKSLPVPNYYYKVALRRKGNSSFSTIGFWYKHQVTGATPAGSVMTVREIEQKTGINFFANLSGDVQDEIETAVNSSDWRF